MRRELQALKARLPELKQAEEEAAQTLSRRRAAVEGTLDHFGDLDSTSGRLQHAVQRLRDADLAYRVASARLAQVHIRIGQIERSEELRETHVG